MKILYLSAVCAQKRFDQCVLEGKITKMPQAQKYHHLLIEGLQKVADKPLTVISSYPIVGGEKKIYHTETEEENGIKYFYPGFMLFPFIRQFCLLSNTIKLIFSNLTKDTVIVCDILNGSVCLAARFVRFFKKVKIVSIVTDVPGLTSGARMKTLPWWKQIESKIMSPINKKSLAKYDGYLLLTEAMNNVVNLRKHPYIVIEGHSDITMKNIENKLEEKSPIKNIMYAGGTHREFGIELLVKSFLAINNKEWELHIYGDGNYQNDLKRIAQDHPNVKYFGMKPNAEIVKNQLKAWVLVNPRITNAEYVKYSFPSKTLECMVSGTPLLTTRLAGMPKDYYPYVYLFDEETKEGFVTILKNVFSKSAEELHDFGKKAKTFALEEKNNVKQANKLYSFLKQFIA